MIFSTSIKTAIDSSPEKVRRQKKLEVILALELIFGKVLRELYLAENLYYKGQ